MDIIVMNRTESCQCPLCGVQTKHRLMMTIKDAVDMPGGDLSDLSSCLERAIAFLQEDSAESLTSLAVSGESALDKQVCLACIHLLNSYVLFSTRKIQNGVFKKASSRPNDSGCETEGQASPSLLIRLPPEKSPVVPSFILKPIPRPNFSPRAGHAMKLQGWSTLHSDDLKRILSEQPVPKSAEEKSLDSSKPRTTATSASQNQATSVNDLSQECNVDNDSTESRHQLSDKEGNAAENETSVPKYSLQVDPPSCSPITSPDVHHRSPTQKSVLLNQDTSLPGISLLGEQESPLQSSPQLRARNSPRNDPQSERESPSSSPQQESLARRNLTASFTEATTKPISPPPSQPQVVSLLERVFRVTQPPRSRPHVAAKPSKFFKISCVQKSNTDVVEDDRRAIASILESLNNGRASARSSKPEVDGNQSNKPRPVLLKEEPQAPQQINLVLRPITFKRKLTSNIVSPAFSQILATNSSLQSEVRESTGMNKSEEPSIVVEMESCSLKSILKKQKRIYLGAKSVKAKRVQFSPFPEIKIFDSKVEEYDSDSDSDDSELNDGYTKCGVACDPCSSNESNDTVTSAVQQGSTDPSPKRLKLTLSETPNPSCVSNGSETQDDKMKVNAMGASSILEQSSESDSEAESPQKLVVESPISGKLSKPKETPELEIGKLKTSPSVKNNDHKFEEDCVDNTKNTEQSLEKTNIKKPLTSKKQTNLEKETENQSYQEKQKFTKLNYVSNENAERFLLNIGLIDANDGVNPHQVQPCPTIEGQDSLLPDQVTTVVQSEDVTSSSDCGLITSTDTMPLSPKLETVTTIKKQLSDPSAEPVKNQIQSSKVQLEQKSNTPSNWKVPQKSSGKKKAKKPWKPKYYADKIQTNESAISNINIVKAQKHMTSCFVYLKKCDNLVKDKTLLQKPKDSARSTTVTKNLINKKSHPCPKQLKKVP